MTVTVPTASTGPRALCKYQIVFLFYFEFYYIIFYRQDSWPYACKSDEEKARKEMSATNVSYYSFWNMKTLIVKVRKLKLSETLTVIIDSLTN